jgi:site-specific DNA-methyltransferase (adenine-specific)
MKKRLRLKSELWQGDCLELMKNIPDGSVKMIWTDPPYGNENGVNDFSTRRHFAINDKRKSKTKPIENDGLEEMKVVIDGMLLEAVRCCAKVSAICCCCGGGGPTPVFAWLANRMCEKGLAFLHSCIWDKKNPGFGWRYRRQHEMIMVAYLAKGKIAWADLNVACGNIFSIAKPTGMYHSNEKPVALVERFIELHTKPGDLVIDPFMGSGTTGVACAKTGRRFIGIEKDPEIFKTAEKRIRFTEQTGMVASKESKGVGFWKGE